MRTSEKKYLFLNRFKTGSHAASAECHCGILNYDVSNKWDEDHQETIKNLKDGPLINLQNNAIEYININDHLFVIGCKCNTDNLLFSMLNEHRDQVIMWIKDTQEKIL